MKNNNKPYVYSKSQYGEYKIGKVAFDSEIAKGENNDCMVRCLATATDTSYDVAHEWCAVNLNRKIGRGTSTRRILDMNGTRVLGHNIERIGEVVVDKWNTPSGSYTMFLGEKMLGKWGYKSDGWGGTRRKFRRMSVATFLKTEKYKTGTYMIAVASHIFCIKDGTVLGNYDDGRKTKKAIEFAYEVK